VTIIYQNVIIGQGGKDGDGGTRHLIGSVWASVDLSFGTYSLPAGSADTQSLTTLVFFGPAEGSRAKKS
jgi:hypothetical protein